MPSRQRLLDRGLGVAIPTVTYAALAIATVAIVARRPEYTLAGDSGLRLAAALAAGGFLLVSALSAPHMPTAERLFLVAAALAWPLAEWNTPGAGAVFTVGLVAYAAWAPLLVAAMVRGPNHQRVGRPEIALIVLAALSSVGVLGLASALVFDPRAEGCFDCPSNRLLVSGSTPAWRDIGHAGLALTAVWTVALLVVAAYRVTTFSPARRAASLPVLLPAAAAVACFGAAALHGFHRGYLSNDPVDRILWLLESAALAVVAAGVASERIRTRRARTALTRLVVELGERPGQTGLRERLASTLHDPSLAVLYRRDDGAGWIDAVGRPASVPDEDDREVTTIRAGDRELAALVHRRGVLDDPALSSEIAVAARLAIEHERLGASRRAHLDELRKSRARIVAAADEERRRLERDLHDGAQQGLVTLAVGVRVARLRHGVGDPELERELAGTERELQRALARLRELAQGLYPSALDEEGLAAAVEVLAEGAPRLILGQLPERRFPPAVETTAYFVVVEALRLAPDGKVVVDIGFSGRSLELDVRSAFALGTSQIRIEDRVVALSGSFHADPRRIRVSLPCES